MTRLEGIPGHQFRGPSGNYSAQPRINLYDESATMGKNPAKSTCIAVAKYPFFHLPAVFVRTAVYARPSLKSSRFENFLFADLIRH
jgi:hypothetical protein